MSSGPSEDKTSPWHPGELRMQQSVGVAERMDGVGRKVIRRFLLEQHRDFYAELPFVVLGSVDDEGDVWATVRAGMPGFLRSPDPSRLTVALQRDQSDPADQGLRDGDAVGLLGIQLETRRRNRLNGMIERSRDDEFDVVVAESFGNCPRYINPRSLRFEGDPGNIGFAELEKLERLSTAAADMVRSADTFFVASCARADGMHRHVDVSHRGGKAGFVRVDESGSITVPDYAGNLFFNTLGNFLESPSAGLIFVDWRRGDLLQMTGDVEVLFDMQETAQFEDAERLWRFFPKQIIGRSGVFPLRMT